MPTAETTGGATMPTSEPGAWDNFCKWLGTAQGIGGMILGAFGTAMTIFRPVRVFCLEAFRRTAAVFSGPQQLARIEKLVESINDKLTAGQANSAWLSLQALNATNVNFFLSDRDGNTTWVSDAWCHLAHMSEDDALGKGWIAAVHPDDSRRVWDEWCKCVKEVRPFLAWYRFLTGTSDQGKRACVYVECRATPKPDGGFLGHVKSIQIADAEKV